MKALLLLLWSLSAAATPVRELNVSSFQVHVRPQLVGIQQDIQQIFLTMPGYPAEVFHALSQVDQLLALSRAAKSVCPGQMQSSCLPQLQSSLSILRDLERQWLSLEARATTATDASITTIAGRKRWLQMMEAARHLQAQLEAEALAIQAGRTGDRMNQWQWRKGVDEIEDCLDLVVVEFVPAKLQADFRSAWMNFFRPVYKQCVLGNNRRFLSKNLDSLNFYWNLLNLKLTKRLKKTPEGMLGPLNAIQNRWNQVMRVQYGS
jgi:hypothetical protein